MSLHPVPAPSVPEATARVTRAVFRNGCLAMRIRDELGPLYVDEQFVQAFPCRGGPAWSPGQLAMVSVLQFADYADLAVMPTWAVNPMSRATAGGNRSA